MSWNYDGLFTIAAFDAPVKLTTEITRADINDVIFFIFFPLLIY
jgi:hypothetical protein